MASSASLFEKCVEKFEALQEDGRLFYTESTAEEVQDENGFKFEFRLIEAFNSKPMPSQGGKESDEHSSSKPDPFGSPDPDFVVGETQYHLLQLNMFNAVKPQLILHPKARALQTEPLGAKDFEAAFEMLDKLAPHSHIVFYNCCPESGSSQPYKHMQLIEKPDTSGFQLLPEQEHVENSEPRLQKIHQAPTPHMCLISHFADISSSDSMLRQYNKMLNKMPRHGTHPLQPHNVIFTKEWLCTVPRRHASINEPTCFANALGMLGMVWVATEEERQEWTRRSYSQYLTELGYPSDITTW